ncbi:hypothetical protein N0V88_003328 [Collariella sp. IMI 366227]|nr:hypothetical protein N0V88_003328 [Collariella sp. IMI 366227]
MRDPAQTEILVAGAIAAFTVDMLVYPLDTIKTRYQSQEFLSPTGKSASKARASLQAFRGLYQGIGSVVLATLPAAALFFATYESAKPLFSYVLPMGTPEPVIHSIASASAEMASCFVLTPAEVIKQNAQVLQQTGPSSGRSSSLEALQMLRRSEAGVTRTLWRGYTALVARNLPFTAMQFPMFEFVRGQLWKRQRHRRSSNPSLADPASSSGGKPGGDGLCPLLMETGLINGSAAAVSGSIAATLTTPADVVKTRIMLGARDSPMSVTARTSKPPQPPRGSGLAVAKAVLREHGIRGLFRGGLLRAAWAALGSGLYLGSYEVAKTAAMTISQGPVIVAEARPQPFQGVDEKRPSVVSDVHIPTVSEKPSQDRYLLVSPYHEQEHLLDLETLDAENQLLALALTKMECLRKDYATAPYLETFNWPEVIETLRALAQKTNHRWKKTSFFVVAFRSQIPPTTVYAELGALDKAAHAEATASGGFLKYWFGTPNVEGRNLATCIWRSQEDARKGGTGPNHRKAAGAARHLYSFWKIDRLRLTVEDDVEGWAITDWKE